MGLTVTHAVKRRQWIILQARTLGSLNSVGGVATEVNAVNFVSPRSWLTCSHWFLAFGLLVGHWWHSGRSRAVASRLALGLSRLYEPVLSVFFLQQTLESWQTPSMLYGTTAVKWKLMDWFKETCCLWFNAFVLRHHQTLDSSGLISLFAIQHILLARSWDTCTWFTTWFTWCLLWFHISWFRWSV